MVGFYGMSTKVGRVRVLTRSNGHLGDSHVVDAASAQLMGAFDVEVKELVDEAEWAARNLLERHQSHLERLAQELQTHESVEGSELERFVAAVAADTPEGEEAVLPAANGKG
jgi:cell division protease FtsH